MADEFCVKPVHRDLPFVIDTWTVQSSHKPQFSTHAHKDHTVGIEQHAREIYCTEHTRQLLCIRSPALLRSRTKFHVLDMPDPDSPEFDEEWEEHRDFGAVEVTTADGTSFSVLPIPAQHCAGAVMLLFQGAFGTVLHTGDARLDARYMRFVPRGLPIDMLYLDCTFGDAPLDFPERRAAMVQVVDLIRHAPPKARVYISAETLGTERVLQHVSRAFGGAQFFLKADPASSFAWLCTGKQAQRAKELDLLCPGLRTEDERSTRFHICGGKDLQFRAAEQLQRCSRRGGVPPLFVRPSTQKWVLTAQEQLHLTGRAARGTACLRTPTAPFEENGIWYVLFSMHSSQSELVAAVAELAPAAMRPICGSMGAAFAAATAAAANEGACCAAEARFSAAAAAAAAAGEAAPIAAVPAAGGAAQPAAQLRAAAAAPAAEPVGQGGAAAVADAAQDCAWEATGDSELQPAAGGAAEPAGSSDFEAAQSWDSEDSGRIQSEAAQRDTAASEAALFQRGPACGVDGSEVIHAISSSCRGKENLQAGLPAKRAAAARQPSRPALTSAGCCGSAAAGEQPKQRRIG